MDQALESSTQKGSYKMSWLPGHSRFLKSSRRSSNDIAQEAPKPHKQPQQSAEQQQDTVIKGGTGSKKSLLSLLASESPSLEREPQDHGTAVEDHEHDQADYVHHAADHGGYHEGDTNSDYEDDDGVDDNDDDDDNDGSGNAEGHVVQENNHASHSPEQISFQGPLGYDSMRTPDHWDSQFSPQYITSSPTAASHIEGGSVFAAPVNSDNEITDDGDDDDDDNDDDDNDDDDSECKIISEDLTGLRYSNVSSPSSSGDLLSRRQDTTRRPNIRRSLNDLERAPNGTLYLADHSIAREPTFRLYSPNINIRSQPTNLRSSPLMRGTEAHVNKSPTVDAGRDFNFINNTPNSPYIDRGIGPMNIRSSPKVHDRGREPNTRNSPISFRNSPKIGPGTEPSFRNSPVFDRGREPIIRSSPKTERSTRKSPFLEPNSRKSPRSDRQMAPTIKKSPFREDWSGPFGEVTPFSLGQSLLFKEDHGVLVPGNGGIREISNHQYNYKSRDLPGKAKLISSVEAQQKYLLESKMAYVIEGKQVQVLQGEPCAGVFQDMVEEMLMGGEDQVQALLDLEEFVKSYGELSCGHYRQVVNQFLQDLCSELLQPVSRDNDGILTSALLRMELVLTHGNKDCDLRVVSHPGS